MCNPFSWISHIISAIGAINWGLVAFLRFNLVEYLSGMVKVPQLNKVIYALIAICGIYSIISLCIKKTCS